ncbi:MAG TPA: MYXO-CTERM sorting domain-containing protein [Polyangiaceae bacterium]|nr:MYXO-CTERM sorting domain-containing protein [Polyangiaceae bacterium]
MNRASLLTRRLLLVLCQLACLLVASSALAAGRVQWKETTVKERDDKSWRLEVAIYMPKAPDVPHVPMKFEFQPTAYYARDMTDGDKLVEHTVPLTDRQSLIESVDVGFLDSGSGKIESRTKFTFKVTRAHGYEAGEYKITIKDTRNGQTVGTPTTLKFTGENEIIDRRAMVFSGDKKKKPEEKKAEADSGGDKPAGDDAATKDDSAGGDEKKADAPADEPKSDEPKGDDNAPPPVEGKPGGCGCKVAGGERSSLPGLLALAGLGVLVARRRRATA